HTRRTLDASRSRSRLHLPVAALWIVRLVGIAATAVVDRAVLGPLCAARVAYGSRVLDHAHAANVIDVPLDLLHGGLAHLLVLSGPVDAWGKVRIHIPRGLRFDVVAVDSLRSHDASPPLLGVRESEAFSARIAASGVGPFACSYLLRATHHI